jgi:hypothetical protein
MEKKSWEVELGSYLVLSNIMDKLCPTPVYLSNMFSKL